MQGKEEREASYRPIRDALLGHFSDIPMVERYDVFPSSQIEPSQTMHRHNFRVLVPGTGLGRLAYDVAQLGMLSNFGFNFRY